MSRFPRSLSEAFPGERFNAAFGPYRRPTSALREVLKAAALLALFAFIGILIGWRV